MKSRPRRKSSLGAWMMDSSSPLFLLNSKCKVLYFNRGCEVLTGWQETDIVGQICEYVSEVNSHDVSSVTSALCPPSEVLSGQNCSIPTYFLHRSGSTTTQVVHFFSLSDNDGQLESILGLITSIDQPIKIGEPTASHRLHAELASVRHHLRLKYGINSFVGNSPAMQRVMSQIKLISSSQESLVIVGEQGTGKEFIARLIHQAGPESQRAFVPLNCRRILPRELLRTLRRLFESFEETDATSPFVRMPGTIYLEQVDALSRDAQQYLIQVYQKHSERSTLPVRLISSSHTDLEEKIEKEILLPDFYYLLATAEMKLPPLRDHMGDLNLLAQHILEQLNRNNAQQISGFEEPVLKEFQKYRWPGNVDELYHVINESREACTSSYIGLQHLPFRFQTGRDAQSISPAVDYVEPLETSLNQYEADLIRKAIQLARRNKTLAAEILQISRPKLYHRMQALGIDDNEE